MDFWSDPTKYKIPEALGAIADGRIEFTDGEKTEAKVFSSSRGKFYRVRIDPAARAIASNDNTAFFVGELSYPAVAVILARSGEFDPGVAAALAGIPWKDWNQAVKNDFAATANRAKNLAVERGIPGEKFDAEVERIWAAVARPRWAKLGAQERPPAGY